MYSLCSILLCESLLSSAGCEAAEAVDSGSKGSDSVELRGDVIDGRIAMCSIVQQYKLYYP